MEEEEKSKIKTDKTETEKKKKSGGKYTRKEKDKLENARGLRLQG